VRVLIVYYGFRFGIWWDGEMDHANLLQRL